MEAFFTYLIVPLLIVLFVTFGVVKFVTVIVDIWFSFARNWVLQRKKARESRNQNDEEEEKQ
jgi:hypothetical protein